jgi:hypothetical protein
VQRAQLLEHLDIALDQRSRFKQQEVGSGHRNARLLAVEDADRRDLKRYCADDAALVALPGERAGHAGQT